MDNIGGRALKNGIVFTSTYQKAVGIIEENGEFNITVEDLNIARHPLLDTIEYYIYKIPLVRGIYDLIIHEKMFFLVFILFALKYIFKILYIMETSINSSNAGFMQNNNIFEIVVVIIIILIICIDIVKEILKICKEIKSCKIVYSFHGAEHKTVNTYLEGKKLTVEEVRKASRVSAACGTNLVIFWVFCGIILFIFLNQLIFLSL